MNKENVCGEYTKNFAIKIKEDGSFEYKEKNVTITQKGLKIKEEITKATGKWFKKKKNTD